MSWLDVAKEATTLAYYGLMWSSFTSAYLVVKLFQLVALPLLAAWKVALFVLAPVTYTVRFFFAPFFTVWDNLPRLAPLYIYFGSAVFIGVLSGLLLTATTTTTFTILGMYGDSNPSRPPIAANAADKQEQQRQERADDAKFHSGSQSRNDSLSSNKDLDAMLAGISSNPESDHLIATLQGGLRGGAWRDPANTKRKRRSMGGGGGGGGGLTVSGRFGTILEEDDDSL